MTDANQTLNRIEVASPCTQSWDAMTGDTKRRFCGECRLHVHNLSAMTQTEASALLGDADGQLCVRFFRRADGTVLTQDCVPVREKLRRRLRRLRVAAAAIFGFLGPLGLAACGAGGGATDNAPDPALPATMGEPLMGDVMVLEEVVPAQDGGANESECETNVSGDGVTPDDETGAIDTIDDPLPRELLGRIQIR